jgi:hypothetical protein
VKTWPFHPTDKMGRNEFRYEPISFGDDDDEEEEARLARELGPARMGRSKSGAAGCLRGCVIVSSVLALLSALAIVLMAASVVDTPPALAGLLGSNSSTSNETIHSNDTINSNGTESNEHIFSGNEEQEELQENQDDKDDEEDEDHDEEDEDHESVEKEEKDEEEEATDEADVKHSLNHTKYSHHHHHKQRSTTPDQALDGGNDFQVGADDNGQQDDGQDNIDGWNTEDLQQDPQQLPQTTVGMAKDMDGSDDAHLTTLNRVLQQEDDALNEPSPDEWRVENRDLFANWDTIGDGRSGFVEPAESRALNLRHGHIEHDKDGKIHYKREEDGEDKSEETAGYAEQTTEANQVKKDDDASPESGEGQEENEEDKESLATTTEPPLHENATTTSHLTTVTEYLVSRTT